MMRPLQAQWKELITMILKGDSNGRIHQIYSDDLSSDRPGISLLFFGGSIDIIRNKIAGVLSFDVIVWRRRWRQPSIAKPRVTQDVLFSLNDLVAYVLAEVSH